MVFGSNSEELRRQFLASEAALHQILQRLGRANNRVGAKDRRAQRLQQSEEVVRVRERREDRASAASMRGVRLKPRDGLTGQWHHLETRTLRSS